MNSKSNVCRMISDHLQLRKLI